MQKRITLVTAMVHGNCMLEFADGSKQVLFKSEKDAHLPQKGDLWPPEGHAHATTGVYAGRLVKLPAAPIPAPAPAPAPTPAPTLDSIQKEIEALKAEKPAEPGK